MPASDAHELVEPLGHTDLVRTLAASARSGSLPHALLLDGPEGIGKFRAALWLAATVLCERGGDEPCGECGSCKRVRSGAHADLFVIDHRAHDQNAITIHFIAHRDPKPKDAYQGEPIDRFLSLRSAEGRGKFVVVREADAMNEEAQNAFLKTLEEPRPGVHLLLETASPASLLATVRSRVVPVAIDALDGATCERVLAERAPDTDPAERARLARMAGGSPGVALRLARTGAARIEDVLAEAFAGARSAPESAAELWDVDGTFDGKTAAARRRSHARAVLDLGLELMTDVERVVAGVPADELRHGDAAVRAAGGAALDGTRKRRELGRVWLSAREDLNLNLSPEGLVDRALLAVGRSGP